jgi:hypothetical protein
MNFLSSILIAVGAIALLVLFSFLLAWPTKELINGLFSPSLIKSVFGTEHVGWMSAWGINVLCVILFKSSTHQGSK